MPVCYLIKLVSC
uniref:Uncharacterized protein n=1 Tax=Arundo donax TaxID=35708 RepID=A0A0A9AIB2_ARUDO